MLVPTVHVPDAEVIGAACLISGALIGLDSATASETVSGLDEEPDAAARRPKPPRV